MHKGLDEFMHKLDVAFNRLIIAFVVAAGLIGSSMIGVFATSGPTVLGLNVVSALRVLRLRRARALADVGGLPLGKAVTKALAALSCSSQLSWARGWPTGTSATTRRDDVARLADRLRAGQARPDRREARAARCSPTGSGASRVERGRRPRTVDARRAGQAQRLHRHRLGRRGHRVRGLGQGRRLVRADGEPRGRPERRSWRATARASTPERRCGRGESSRLTPTTTSRSFASRTGSRRRSGSGRCSRRRSSATSSCSSGSPLGYEGSVTSGVVGRVADDEIQTDAAAYPGISGGPAVDENGQVVGVLVSGEGENLNFAVPINLACMQASASATGVAARARCRIFGTDSRKRTSGGEAGPALASVACRARSC